MNEIKDNSRASVMVEFNVEDNICGCTSSIVEAMETASLEILKLNETITSIKNLKPECDKIDYALAASSGAVCGLIDIFLVGKPGDSSFGEITDKWFEDKTKSFAKLCGWQGDNEKPISSAIRFLEKRFDVPYDQRGAGDAGSFVFDLNPTNHHFKSLAHNPSLLGLFFSILDQFKNESHFVTEGKLISLTKADKNFELRGNNIPSKLFCAFTNWLGHILSDISGASSSKGRGMGIPSPLWTWTNDVIAIKEELKISSSQFDKAVNELAINIYNEGYDVRFQSTQIIPVFINELIVRLIYAIRRLISYCTNEGRCNFSLEEIWKRCEPFSNPTVKRMLTVAHGTFCALDIGDATIRSVISGGGSVNPSEFLLRLNVAGVGRFVISIYGEGKRSIILHKARKEVSFAEKEKLIVQDYIEGLQILSDIYDDDYWNFISDLQSDMYIQAFEKSVLLAKKRNSPNNVYVKNKAELDAHFSRR